MPTERRISRARASKVSNRERRWRRCRRKVKIATEIAIGCKANRVVGAIGFMDHWGSFHSSVYKTAASVLASVVVEKRGGVRT